MNTHTLTHGIQYYAFFDEFYFLLLFDLLCIFYIVFVPVLS